MKVIHCGDVIPGSTVKVRADNEADLMQRFASHVRQAHPEVELTPNLMQSAKEKTREEAF